MPANILNLPQYRVLRVEETDHDYHVTAEPVDVSSSCYINELEQTVRFETPKWMDDPCSITKIGYPLIQNQ